jgi:hypothetical protein
VSLPVLTTPEADAQIREVDRWWRANRPASPDLFAEERSRRPQQHGRVVVAGGLTRSDRPEAKEERSMDPEALFDLGRALAASP